MLPILVLALAASAFAAPGVQNIRLVNSNEVGPGNSAVENLFDLIDGGDKFLSELNLGQILRDLSESYPAIANGQALAGFAEIATGIPGDSCAAANYINAYANYLKGGSAGAVRDALAGFISALSAKIDNIVALTTNKDSVRFSSGVRGGCPSGGRNYQFENVWDVILGNARNLGLAQEAYSATKRMYCSFAARPGNVGAAVTAASLPPSFQLWERVSGPLTNFINAVISKSNAGAAAASLKQAINYEIPKIVL